MTKIGLHFLQRPHVRPSQGRLCEASLWDAQADSIIPSVQGVQTWDRFAYTNNNPMRYTDPSGHTICLDGEQCYTGSGTKPGGGSSGSAGRGKEMGDDYQENGDSNNTAPSNNGLDIEISNSIYTPILNSNDYPNLDENIIYDYSVFPPKPIGIKYTSWTSVHINPDAQVNALNNFTTSVAVEYILTKVSAPSGVGVLIGAIMTINDITYTEQHMGSKEVYFYHLIEFELPRIDIETGRPLPLITSNFFPSVTR